MPNHLFWVKIFGVFIGKTNHIAVHNKCLASYVIRFSKVIFLSNQKLMNGNTMIAMS